jgi:hypothetical protein
MGGRPTCAAAWDAKPREVLMPGMLGYLSRHVPKQWPAYRCRTNPRLLRLFGGATPFSAGWYYSAPERLICSGFGTILANRKQSFRPRLLTIAPGVIRSATKPSLFLSPDLLPVGRPALAVTRVSKRYCFLTERSWRYWAANSPVASRRATDGRRRMPHLTTGCGAGAAIVTRCHCGKLGNAAVSRSVRVVVEIAASLRTSKTNRGR